ncbi:MAG: hypothetical protein KDD09_22765 [Phaeodactylibacter sp.]|nr:hypothetical protein [Phaeodactylibacter sp.]
MKKLALLLGIYVFIGGMAEADAQCRVYEKVSGINYSGNPDGGKHVITTSGCDATQTAAGVAAYLLIIRE